MLIDEKGVMEDSEIYFHTPSKQALQLFFHLLCCGNYRCDVHYKVQRETYNSYLLLFVVKGYGYVIKNKKRVSLPEGSLAVINCFEPHSYGTDTGWKILWAHFDGSMATCWFHEIEDTSNGVVKPENPQHNFSQFLSLISMFKSGNRVSEPEIHKIITTLLTSFLQNPVPKSGETDVIARSMRYINNNIRQDLPVKKLAEHACLSPYYFIRLFKKTTGYSPHDYLIRTRVYRARYYLSTTEMQIKEIAYLCGFKSSSAFCSTFKKITRTTPVNYRNSKTKS